MQNPQDVQHAAQALRDGLLRNALDRGTDPKFPRLGLILGTGLGDSLRMKIIASAPFESLPGFPVPRAASHKGNFILAEIGGLICLAQQGRCHLYEGHSPAQACMGVRVMHELGIGALIITNAAGALNPLFEAGSIMCIADMINHTGLSPLTGPNHDAWGERFPDMSAPFDQQLQKLALNCARLEQIRLERGVYIGVHGPEMETPAETRMYRQWGADAIGMSSVLEIIAARHLGMRVLGFSALANKNLPDCMEAAPIEEVIHMAKEAGKALGRLIEAMCRELRFTGGIDAQGASAFLE